MPDFGSAWRCPLSEQLRRQSQGRAAVKAANSTCASWRVAGSVFVIPLCVVIGWMMDKPMTMNFHFFETSTMLLTSISIAIILMDGKANWLKGTMLLLGYSIIGAGFWAHADPDQISPSTGAPHWSGTGYPGTYTLGSHHTGRAAATAAAYGALVGSVSSFGAMFEGASAMCFGLDGALFAVCGLLLGANVDPSLRGFLEVRGLYVAIHMGIDIMRGCSSPYGTIGNVSHLAGFVGGFCYVLVMLPEIGGRPVPTVPCLRKKHSSWNEDRCLAFFSREYSAGVDEVQSYAAGILGLGIALALLNAFVCQRQAHASADGYSIFVKGPDHVFEQAVARTLREFREREMRYSLFDLSPYVAAPIQAGWCLGMKSRRDL
eukprot:s316_g2.t1